MWAIAGNVTRTWHINDNFYTIQDMCDYLKYRYSVNKMFEHYEYRLNILMQNVIDGKNREFICIRDYKKLKFA